MVTGPVLAVWRKPSSRPGMVGRRAVGTCSERLRLAMDRLVGQCHDVWAVPGHAGDEVDIDAYLRGQPEQMIGYQLCHDQQGKQATMLVNCSLPSRVSAECIMRRGGALYAAIEALRADGYSLGLTMAEASCPDFARQVAGVEYRVPVVHPGDYLDVDTAAFCLANPAFLRRGVFAVNEHESSALRREMGFHREGGYGTPTTLLCDIPPNSFVIDVNEGLDLDSDAQMQQFAQAVVDKTLRLLAADRSA